MPYCYTVEVENTRKVLTRVTNLNRKHPNDTYHVLMLFLCKCISTKTVAAFGAFCTERPTGVTRRLSSKAHFQAENCHLVAARKKPGLPKVDPCQRLVLPPQTFRVCVRLSIE